MANRPVSREEADQLTRSTKKIKRVGENSDSDAMVTDGDELRGMEDMNMEPGTCIAPTEREQVEVVPFTGRSYSDMVQQNNPNLNFTAMTNPMWEDTDDDVDSGDDEPTTEDDPLCPTICLTSEEKKLLRNPWRKALILTTLDKGIGFMQLKRRLKLKWALKGDFSLIDIGCDYYVTRFTNAEDYEHVLTQGPWMLGDNYLVIREWVPNFIPEEDCITRITAWVRIPRLCVEYFNKSFLLEKIGKKIGRVIRVDDTTANVERGPYTRLCVEVDLTKPLLSKFRLNGRIWCIQYEGRKMICFHCGKQGHKEDSCPLKSATTSEEVNGPNQVMVNLDKSPSRRPEVDELYGSWMLVKKPVRRRATRQPNQNGNRTAPSAGSNRNDINQAIDPRMEAPQPTRVLNGIESMEPNLERSETHGSRFRALADFEQDMGTTGLEVIPQSQPALFEEHNPLPRLIPEHASFHGASTQSMPEAQSRPVANRFADPLLGQLQGLAQQSQVLRRTQEPNRRQPTRDNGTTPEGRGRYASHVVPRSTNIGPPHPSTSRLEGGQGTSSLELNPGNDILACINPPRVSSTVVGVQNGDPPDRGDPALVVASAGPSHEILRPHRLNTASILDVPTMN